jgi:MHS family proline/betaine transporter-like MFS transporter
MMGASETLTAAREATPRDRAAARRKAILSCSIGNFLELFDFVVFGFFAATIGRNFFPSIDPTISLLSSFATYGVGFVMRPVGAMLLGAYGDRHGRKGMLIITISLMALATGGMAVVPPYAVIGIWAPILLLVCRLLQGFATGGEWGAAATFLVEYAEPGRRGLTGSFQQVGFGFGMIGGTLSATLVNGLLSPAAVESWGWRVPFMLGCFIAPVAVYIRSHVAETPLFRKTEAAHHVAASPLGEALRLYWREVLTVAGIGVVGTVAGYICNVFLPPFAIQRLGLPAGSVYLVTTVSSIVQTVGILLAGALSDRIGRKPVLMISAVGYLVLIYPLFLLLTRSPSMTTFVLAQIIPAILVAMNSGPLAAVLCELFPTRVRLTALSVGYSLAVAVFGGFAPFIATFLIRLTGDLVSPTYYGLLCAAITVVTLLRMRDPTNRPLDADDTVEG